MVRPKPTPQPNSRVHRAIVRDEPVYLKQYVPGGWLQTPEIVQTQAAREIEIVGRLASLPGLTGRLGIVQIVEADPSEPFVVTREVRGQPLQDLLRRSRRLALRGTCVRALYLTGKWLRVFQTLPTDSQVTVSAPSDPEDLVDYCDLRLKTLMELGYCWPSERNRQQVLQWLARRVEATLPQHLTKVWCHGDFGAANLIWDGRVLTPIDLATCRLDLPLVDVIYLIHRLEMLPVQFPWRRWPIALYRKACLRGYGLPDAEQLPIYDALMVRHLLCRLQTLVRRPPTSRRQAWHNAWMRWRVRARLTRILQ